MDQSDIAGLLARAQEFLNKGQLEKAHQLCVSIVQAQPRHADAYFLLGIIAGSMGQHRKSIQLIEKAISYNDSSSEYFAHYAKTLYLANDFIESKRALERSIELVQKDALTCDTIGALLCKFGDYRTAVVYFEKAIKQKSNTPSFHFNLGAANKALGDFDRAKKSYRQAVKLQPKFYAAHAALSEIGGATEAAGRLEELKQHLAGQANNVNDELVLCSAIAMDYASIGDHDQSFAYLHRGNTRKADSSAYEPEEDDRLFEAVQSAKLGRSVEKRNLEQAPIFVVGMPRSGTTLVERILSNHSQITSAGELQVLPLSVKKATKSLGRQILDLDALGRLPDLNMQDLGDEYLRESRAFIHEETLRFIDKQPLNFWYIPLILKALPEAKVICLKRHPLDVCFGNYKTLFSLGSPYYDYSFDLISTARYVDNFQRLIGTWTAEFAGQFYTVDYERLVEAPEEEVSKLLDYVELPWEEKCLDIQSNTSPVATASSVQVRRPINSDSIGRWKKYRSYMDDVERYFEDGM